MMNMVREERGAALLLVLVLLALGGLLLTPTLQSVFTSQRSGQIQTRILQDQYARDGGSEYAVWELLYGTATSQLSQEGEEVAFPLDLNGISSTVRVRLQATLGDATIGGAEDNRVRLTSSVVCEISSTSSAFDDNCETLPKNTNGMRAKYTVFLDQVSPDTSVPVVAIYDELPQGFSYDPILNPAVSDDLSFPEITLVSPTNIGSAQNQIWKWDFSATPITFEQGQVRQFTFVVGINGSQGGYCSRVFTKMESPPHESSGPQSRIEVETADGCDNGGMFVKKYVSQILALPGQTTVFTYIVNVENFEGNSQQIDLIKDVLPQGGYLFCNGPTQGDPTKSCDPPMFKLVSTNFDPVNDSFDETASFTNTLPDPTQTFLDPDGIADSGDERWELVWSDGWGLDQAGNPLDTMIIRFEAEFTPTESGSFYNEVFTDVNCSVPVPLRTAPDDVTTADEYCASYSWPSGGSLVPTYDVRAETGDSSGWGNVTVGSGTGQLESWHVEEQ